MSELVLEFQQEWCFVWKVVIQMDDRTSLPACIFTIVYAPIANRYDIAVEQRSLKEWKP